MADNLSAEILLTGDVQSADFPGWIAQHAHKLGLDRIEISHDRNGVRVTARGPEEMLHALALGASLGPETVLVETMAIATSKSAGSPR